MSYDADKLFDLLPTIYRIRDAEQGGPLRALVELLAREAGVVEDDISRLYDNWFIETCDEWVVPYIGDLLGMRGLHSLSAFSQRPRVANTLAFRRRKGTATMLEQLARDTTGWPARAVEFFELLGWTQHGNHLRLHSLRTPDLRDTNRLELLDGPFDSIAHTADVRRIAASRGRHNIPDVGIFLWRLQSYAVADSDARAVAEPADGRYSFNPLGLDAPLFNRPQTEDTITHLAEEHNVPDPLRRRPLFEELNARRAAMVAGATPDAVYFGAAQPVLEVAVQANPGDPYERLEPEQLLVCNLEDWRRPVSEVFLLPDGTSFETRVAVDPVTGRLAFPSGVLPNRVKVSCAYGFSGDLGGGPYGRASAEIDALARGATWQVGVSREKTRVGAEQIFTTLLDAVLEWNQQPAGTVGIIAVMDSASYAETLTNSGRIIVPEGSRLLIVAADWPVEADASGLPVRRTGRLVTDDVRPHLRGDWQVLGSAPAASLTSGELLLDGLLIEGTLSVQAGRLGRLQLSHCTLAPKGGEIKIGTQNERLRVSLIRCISGAIRLSTSTPALDVVECIVDPIRGKAILAPAAQVLVRGSTLLGKCEALMLEASDSIFMDTVLVERQQVGCVRFCFVPDNSATPRRYRCQPDLALEGAGAQAAKNIRARVKPLYTSTRYGDPAYCQLDVQCPAEIAQGAADGSEMGAFGFLQQPQREANLRASLDEYLRFGLEAGLVFVT